MTTKARTKSIKADRKEVTAREKAEQLLQRRAHLEAEVGEIQKSVKDTLEPLVDEKAEIDKQLHDLSLQETDWFPEGKKTAKFTHGELVWRASSKLVNENGDPITADNTDLLKLAKKFPHCVKISPSLTDLKPYIMNADLRHKLKDFDIDILVEDKFNVKSYPVENVMKVN
jgi:seryl-tRNA synthetase